MTKFIKFPDNRPLSAADKFRNALLAGIEWSVTEFFKEKDVIDYVSELTFAVAVRATVDSANDGFNFEASRPVFMFILPDGQVNESGPDTAEDLGTMLREQLYKQPEFELYAALLKGLTQTGPKDTATAEPSKPSEA